MNPRSHFCYRVRIKIYPLFLILVASASLHAQHFDKEKMDSLFNLIEQHEQGMGSVSIFKDGKEVYNNAIGYADVEQTIKADTNTKYRIGSISKTFTAAIILQLVEEEKLALNSLLSDYFPDIPNANAVTIEHLLKHRSGLYNFTNSGDYMQWRFEPKSKAELLEIVVKNGTVFKPGEKYGYSNTNYVLLSFIIEKIENRPLSEVLKARICTPLNLTNTYYGGRINTAQNEAQSYKMGNSWQRERETDMSIPTGAGAIVSTPHDLNMFFSALLKGQIVNESSLNAMKSFTDGYGLGLMKFPFYNRSAIGHSGGIDGFVSNSGYFEDEDVATSYTSNGVVMPFNDVLIGILSIYFGRPYQLPDFDNQLVLTSEDLDAYLGTYASKMLPLKLTISKQGNQLTGQATGQNAFPLHPFDKDQFKFDAAGIKIEFKPEERKLILRQGDGEFEFVRED